MHILKKIYEKILLLDYKSNAELYWNSRASDLYTLHEKYPSAYLDVVSGYLQILGPRSLLEIGCGNMRLYPVYKDIPMVVGIDISQKFLSLSKRYPNLTLMVARGEYLPFRESVFDIVVCCKVLAHIPDCNIATVIHNIMKASGKYVLVIESALFDEDEITGRYIFKHDYSTLFLNAGAEILHEEHLIRYERHTKLFLFKKVII